MRNSTYSNRVYSTELDWIPRRLRRGSSFMPHPQVIAFRKTKDAFGGLSNMAGGYPIWVNEVLTRSPEALYQACRFPNKPDIQARIIEQKSPLMAKRVMQPYKREYGRLNWFNVKLSIMDWCLHVKLAWNLEKFGRLLDSTGNMCIVEDSHNNTFWGAKPERNDRETLIGSNHLGLLLMDLRTFYREFKSKDQILNSIEPLDMPDFLLLGEPIRRIVVSLP